MPTSMHSRAEKRVYGSFKLVRKNPDGKGDGMSGNAFGNSPNGPFSIGGCV
jgi:hypothetical protein